MSLELKGEKLEFWSFYPVLADEVIAKGDFVYWDGTSVKSAANYTWASSDAATRTAFKAAFLGIAGDDHRAGDSARDMKVFTDAEVGVDLGTANTFAPGDLLGISITAGVLDNQKMNKVTPASEAIGSIQRRYATSVSSVRAWVRSSRGGPGVLGYKEAIA